jgi:hypothetical protein
MLHPSQVRLVTVGKANTNLISAPPHLLDQYQRSQLALRGASPGAASPDEQQGHPLPAPAPARDGSPEAAQAGGEGGAGGPSSQVALTQPLPSLGPGEEGPGV